jgi:hypothetical protein
MSHPITRPSLIAPETTTTEHHLYPNTRPGLTDRLFNDTVSTTEVTQSQLKVETG